MMKINKLMTLQLIAAMAVSVSLTSCSNNSTVGNSSATGWKINGKKDGFQYNTNYNGPLMEWLKLKVVLSLWEDYKKT